MTYWKKKLVDVDANLKQLRKEYWYNFMEEMQRCEAQPKTYWRMLKKRRQQLNEYVKQEIIDEQKYRQNFEGINQ